MSDVHRRVAATVGTLVAAGAVVLLAGRAGESLAAHMSQHVLLLNVAAPLIAVGLPEWRSRRWIAWLAAAAVIEVAVILAWHAPPFYDSAARVELVHAAEHLSFLGTAVLLWWTILGRRDGRALGAGVLALFLTALPTVLLGAGMVFARTPWYAAYPRLEDQQVAGAVMWGFGGAASVLAAAGLFAAWVATTR